MNMRKRTKSVATASAAAIFAIGASMTSFAATGWVEENSEWYYYDKDGVRVEDEWKKSGDYWYWLDGEKSGAMAIDKLIEDGDNYYYVDSTGKMTANTWVKVINEDQDDNDEPAEYNYYYMQSSGKAYKAGDSGNTKFRTVDGKKYAFADDGKMLYGWVDETGNRLSDDSEWEGAMYYLGSWDDGAMKTGWQKVYVYDQDEDDNLEYWFNFKSNGKKRFKSDSDDGNIKEVKINGKKYGFDNRGVMTYEWTLATGGDAARASTSNWKYFSSPEDGARVTKGWFKIIPPVEDNSFGNVISGPPTRENTFSRTRAEDETKKWYYADGDGNLYAGGIKKIKGKYYGFHPEGYMLNHLVLMSVNDDGTIKRVWDDSVDGDDLDDLLNSEYEHSSLGNPEDDNDVSMYYFGNDADHDGSLKTGAATITVDGESYEFFFSKTGGAEARGKGISGVYDGKYIYKLGVKLKADSEDKYMVVYATGDTSTDGVEVRKESSQPFRSDADSAGKNKHGDSVKWIGTANSSWDENYYLLNTSGNIQNTKTAAKDAYDWYFYVVDKNIIMYTNNKNLTGTSIEGWKTWN